MARLLCGQLCLRRCQLRNHNTAGDVVRRCTCSALWPPPVRSASCQKCLSCRAQPSGRLLSEVPPAILHRRLPPALTHLIMSTSRFERARGTTLLEALEAFGPVARPSKPLQQLNLGRQQQQQGQGQGQGQGQQVAAAEAQAASTQYAGLVMPVQVRGARHPADCCWGVPGVCSYGMAPQRHVHAFHGTPRKRVCGAGTASRRSVCAPPHRGSRLRGSDSSEGRELCLRVLRYATKSSNMRLQPHPQGTLILALLDCSCCCSLGAICAQSRQPRPV